ncbi:MAG: hypothetical protein NT051_02240, partial [Candidatus Micrarchaeota archaeon]|nr:hypothetical protein [Candidatus Micrarchaeota archaeon]
MGIGKFPLSTEIPWDRIQKVRVSRDGSAYSFEFEIAGKKQLFTVKTTPNQTEFTLSKPDGVPIVHATQKGRE